MRKQKLTMIRAGIPLARGEARHIETGRSHQAAVMFVSKARSPIVKAEVERIYTPDEPLKRVHELLHAKHTDPTEKWPDVSDATRDIIEDVKLHKRHWPFPSRKTPKVIKDSIERVVIDEVESLKTAVKLSGGIETPDIRIQRLMSVLRFYSLPDAIQVLKSKNYLVDDSLISVTESQIICEVIELCSKKVGWRKAAKLFEALVSPPRPDEKQKPKKGNETEKSKPSPVNGETMDIIELPRLLDASKQTITETEYASSGRTISSRELLKGSRFIRPHRLFVREIEEDVLSGTILIDASGSMDISKQALNQLCEKLPAATIGYYSGHSPRQGTLRIYAKNGKRAAEAPTQGRGNEIDASALKWLLEQKGPRYFITDGEFCQGADNVCAMARAQLEYAKAAGEVSQLHDLPTARQHFGIN